jgi:hypothetical protein
MWQWNLDIETKEYKKNEGSRDEIHETHSRMKFVRAQKK